MINIEELPTFILIKELFENAPSQFRKMSSLCATYLGWDNPEKSYGRSDYDIPCKMSTSAGQFIDLDSLCLRSQKKLLSLEFQHYSLGWKAMLVERVPMPSSRMILQAIEVTKGPFFNLAHSLINSKLPQWSEEKSGGISYVLGDEHANLPLSSRQKECLFYLARGKTAKHIARLLKIDHRTVETHILHVKNKLGCQTKEQLIDKAFESGFVYFIPESLLP